MFYIHSKVHHLRCFENTIYGDLNTDRKGGTSLTTISHSIIRVSRRWVTPVYLRVNPWPRLSRVSYAELTVAPSPTRAVVNVGWRAPISRSGNYWPAPIECPLMLLRARRSFFRCHEACTRAICILRALCAGDGTVGHTYIPFPRETPIPSDAWPDTYFMRRRLTGEFLGSVPRIERTRAGYQWNGMVSRDFRERSVGGWQLTLIAIIVVAFIDSEWIIAYYCCGGYLPSCLLAVIGKFFSE